MKLELKKDGQVVATGTEGQPMDLPAFAISIGKAFAGWQLEVPVGERPSSVVDPETEEVVWDNSEWEQLPPAGLYEIVAVEPETPVEPEEPEQEYLRPLFPTEFARLLQMIRTEDWPDGVLPSDVRSIMDQIPDRRERELALWDFDRASTFERDNPRIDQIGQMLGLMPAEIDTYWRSI